MSTEFYWVALALVTIVSSARISRLATFDAFPPALWVRRKYLAATDSHPDWGLLALCGYCFSFWSTALIVGTGYLAHVYGHPPDDLSGWALAWWLINGTLAASYAAAVFMKRDGDDSEGAL